MEKKSTLVNNKGQTLVVHYREGDPYHDVADKHFACVHAFCFYGDKLVIVLHKESGWVPPGGGIEPGETYEEAVVREIAEETNMRVLHQRLIGYQDVQEPGRIVRQTRSFCVVEPIGDFIEDADPEGDISANKHIDPTTYKEYFNWGEIGEHIMIEAQRYKKIYDEERLREYAEAKETVLALEMKNVSKTFSFPVKDASRGFFKNLFLPEKREVHAVRDISISVRQGERVAFIGPNGAGKSTTIKMLTGILQPSAGNISVLGMSPSTNRKKLAYQIGTVFGQRSQLLPNLPLTDSLEFFGVMYDMPKERIAMRIKKLISLFEMESFVDQPVRKLSLGQRMRAEIAASIIHEPKIIFLDEPTIGLDVVAKKTLRNLLLSINRDEGTTIFLTSHDVGDIEALCDRTIIINHGGIVKDLPTAELTNKFVTEKNISITPATTFDTFPILPEGISYVSKGVDKIVVALDLSVINTQDALRALIDIFTIDDIDVFSANLEDTIRHIYESPQT